MPNQTDERCYACDHPRSMHTPRCTHADCGCEKFKTGIITATTKKSSKGKENGR
jgi:hypothetical protein